MSSPRVNPSSEPRAKMRPTSCWRSAAPPDTLPESPAHSQGRTHMDQNKGVCPDCDGGEFNFDRRRFLRTAAAAAVALPLGAAARVVAAPTPKSAPETAVKALYETLTDKQKKEICFAWDFKDARGLLRTHVSNN